MLKQSEMEAFSQEAGANVAMHGAPGFGIYGVDIFVKTDDAEKAVQLIKGYCSLRSQQHASRCTETAFHAVSRCCPRDFRANLHENTSRNNGP